jgi:hypothetical protein
MTTLSKIRLWWLRWKLDRTKLDPNYVVKTGDHSDVWVKHCMEVLRWKLKREGEIIVVEDERPA